MSIIDFTVAFLGRGAEGRLVAQDAGHVVAQDAGQVHILLVHFPSLDILSSALTYVPSGP